MNTNKYLLTLLFLLSCLIFNCTQKPTHECAKELDCDDCTCLFEKMQQNLHDPVASRKIRECYDKACK